MNGDHQIRNQRVAEAQAEQETMIASLFSRQIPAVSLSPIAGIEETGFKYFNELPIKMLDSWPDARELASDAVAALASSIEKNGVLQPILVRPQAYGRFQIIAGHRRVAAVKELAARRPSDRNWKSIRALVLEMSDEQAAAAAATTNDRTGFNRV